MHCRLSLLITDDGSWWISGRDPATGEWSVAVSRTWRRTWHVDDQPEPARMRGTAMATADGVLVTVEGIGSPDGWRSRDRGRTFGAPKPTDALGTAARGRGGCLVSAGGGTRWYRSPNATTWSPLAFPPD